MLVEISHKWYDIGLQIKVKPNVLNRIQSQYSDPAVCLRMTLSDWLVGINPYPTWEALAKALESRSVKEDRLAKKVRETFLVSVTSTHPAPAPPTAHPSQPMAYARTQLAADPSYHPSIHTYTPAEYNPTYTPIVLTPSQQSTRFHPYDLAYFTRPPTAIPPDPPQRPRVPLPSFPTHLNQPTTPSNNSHMAMPMNPTPYPSQGPYTVPPHPHYGYTPRSSTPPQPHPIPSAATPKLAPKAPDSTYHLPTQRLSPLASTPPQPHPIPSAATPKLAPMAPDLTYHLPTQKLSLLASTPPQPHPTPNAATPIQHPMDPMHHPPTQRPPTHAPLPPYTPAPKMHPVDRYANYLRAYYRQRKLPIHSKWPPTASKKYIHLAVVKKKEVSKQQADEFTRATLHGNIEDIIRKKESLDFSGIGKKENGSPAQFILVEGGPGIGKTTFAWKVCRKWSKGKILQKYRLVVLLRLRDKRVREARSICDLLYYPDEEVRRDVAQEVTHSNGGSVLLLYEGYDELPRKLQTQESIFLDILYQECLPGATVLITSRPSATQFLRDKFKENFDQHIEILGFTKADVHSYLQSVIQDQQLHKEFSQYLKCYPHIRGLMYVPLNAVIVTEIYKTAKLNKSEEFVPTTLTELYTSLTQGMLLRYLKSHNEHGKQEWKLSSFLDLPQDLLKQFYAICGIAFQGILKDEFIFDDLPRDFNTLDLMQSAPELYVDQGAVVSHNFFHLTLQEFLAAVHASQQPTQQQLQYFLLTTPAWINRQLEQELVYASGSLEELDQLGYTSESFPESSHSRTPLSTSHTDILQDFIQAMQPTEPLTTTPSESLTLLKPSQGLRKPTVPPTLPRQLLSPGILPPRFEQPLTSDLESINKASTSSSEDLAFPQSESPLPPIQLSQLQQVLETLRLQGLLLEPESTMEPSTSTSEHPTILELESTMAPSASTSEHPTILELESTMAPSTSTSEHPTILELESTMAPSASTSEHPTIVVPRVSESELIETSTLPRPREVLQELQLAERKTRPLQETPQVPLTPPSLTIQDQGTLEPLQVPMTPRPTSESTPPRPESPAIPDTADIGRLQLEIPQLEPPVPQQLLSQREISPITNPRPVIPRTLPVSPPAGSLPYAVLTSSHFQNVVKFTAGLTKLKGIPTDCIKSILLQGRGDKQVIPLYSLHWLFEAQCISKYSEMIGETTTLTFDRSYSRMTPFDCFVLGFALSHINSRWDINIEGSLIGDEGLEMMVAGINYKVVTLPPSLKSISLNLESCDISSVGLSHLKEMPEQVATRITKLYLSHNRDISEGVASLLSNLTSLKRLYLGATSISTQEVELLAELLSHSQSHKLEYLNLEDSLKSPESTSLILTALSNNTTLRDIYLWEAHVSENNLSLLTSALRTNTTLRELGLGECKINDNMMSEITSALCDNSTLQTLNLILNAIGPSGAIALADMLRRNTTLRVLNIWGNSIGEEGTLKLATSLEHNKTLKELVIVKEYEHSLPPELPLKTKNRITFIINT